MNERTSDVSLSEVNASVETEVKGGFWRRLMAFIGPAYLVSVGYMDPGNWATDLAGGSRFGYALLWVLLMSNLIALLLQSLSARLGVVARRDLAQASRELYHPAANIFLYVMAEIAIAACDLAEVLGMAIGLQLLFDIPLLWGVGISVFDAFLLLLLMHLGDRRHFRTDRDHRRRICRTNVFGETGHERTGDRFYSIHSQCAGAVYCHWHHRRYGNAA